VYCAHKRLRSAVDVLVAPWPLRAIVAGQQHQIQALTERAGQLEQRLANLEAITRELYIGDHAETEEHP
jgi:hypothetical protein